MEVRHAELLDIYGRPAKYDGITIVPARLELAGDGFSSSFPLAEISAARIPPVLRRPIEDKYDVAWVRARIPCVFGTTPEPSEREKSLLLIGFVAVPDGSDEGVGFECSDYYGKTSLTFSPEEWDQEMVERVADAFWNILLQEPDALADFSTRVFHPGACVWMTFGCEDGEPFEWESNS